MNLFLLFPLSSLISSSFLFFLPFPRCQVCDRSPLAQQVSQVYSIGSHLRLGQDTNPFSSYVTKYFYKCIFHPPHTSNTIAGNEARLGERKKSSPRMQNRSVWLERMLEQIYYEFYIKEFEHSLTDDRKSMTVCERGGEKINLCFRKSNLLQQTEWGVRGLAGGGVLLEGIINQ